jgi:Zn-dependent protease
VNIPWTIPGGRIFGIPVRLHLTLFIFFAWQVWRAVELLGTRGLWLGPVLILMAYVTTLLHELGHCFAGEHVGGHADQILLWPLGGLAFLEGLPQRPGPQIFTSLAGPAVNVAICIILGVILGVAGKAHGILPATPIIGTHMPWPPDISLTWFLVCYAFGFSVLNAAFNLMPAYPLDGGKVLVWSLTPRMGYWRAAMVGTMVGMIFGGGLAIVGLFQMRPMLVLLGLFIGGASWLYRKQLAQAGPGLDGDTFGYDFSQGYTSLERSAGGRPPREPRRPGPIRRWLDRRAARRREREMTEELAVRRRVDELLQKINDAGMGALSEREKTFLKDASKRFKT